MQDINDYSYLSKYISCEDTIQIRIPKTIARIKICGGGLTFTINDTMQFEMPTKEQCENLRKTFGIEVELVEEEVNNNNLVDGKLSTHHIDYVDGELKIITD